MEKLNKMPFAFLIAIYFLAKIADPIFHPLKGLPEPDFNNVYDASML
ncbi:MAG: hypothetical protein ABI675_29165 [Chitinophagaceae bacterium]